jgi:DNA-binding NtrC family response regulator
VTHTPADPSNRRRILIAEDEIAIAVDLETHLRDAGFEPVGPALSARDLEHLSHERELHAAVIDLGLLGPDHERLVAPLLARKIKVILMTGYDNSVSTALDAQVERVLKPAHMPDVVARLRELIADQE